MTEQTNDALSESLSALVDGEATPLEVRRLLKASAAEAELNGRWARYHLAGSVMRRDLAVMAPEGFAAGVADALADEQGSTSTALKSSRRWFQGLGRVAVAASVAGAVLIGVQQYPGGVDGPGADASLASDAEQGSRVDQPDSDLADNQPVSLPAGYQAPSFPAARTASAQSGYEPRVRASREVIFMPVQSESVAVPAEEIRAYLNQLMQEHSDHAARNSNQGVLPFARVSSDEDE